MKEAVLGGAALPRGEAAADSREEGGPKPRTPDATEAGRGRKDPPELRREPGPADPWIPGCWDRENKPVLFQAPDVMGHGHSGHRRQMHSRAEFPLKAVFREPSGSLGPVGLLALP